MTLLTGVVRPTALVDASRVRRNIARMAAKATAHGVRFRPHFKTHQAATIGEWFREAGVSAITVSSFDMAAYFAAHGWTDITVAFPVNWRQIDLIDDLAARVRLHLLVESIQTVHFLGRRLRRPTPVWIEIDAGYGRSGARWNDASGLVALAESTVDAGNLQLQGLLTHDGTTYGVTGVDAIAARYTETTTRLERARGWLTEYGFLGLEISVGDTPACSVLDRFGAVDEIRPGNFVFYDWMQMQIGACTADEVGLVVACPVVASYPERNDLILYGGAVHLAKDFLRREDGSLAFGAVVLLGDDGWSAPIPGAWVRSLSQEHGIVHAEPEVFSWLTERVGVGDLLGVLPVHSCLTADLLRHYLTLDGMRIDMAPL
jgi:D-serine deaminase-like pyridoxal phosphate-dependent protein